MKLSIRKALNATSVVFSAHYATFTREGSTIETLNPTTSSMTPIQGSARNVTLVLPLWITTKPFDNISHTAYGFMEPPTHTQREARAKSNMSAEKVGYPHNDLRPVSKANRAGTRGFRAPEYYLNVKHKREVCTPHRGFGKILAELI